MRCEEKHVSARRLLQSIGTAHDHAGLQFIQVQLLARRECRRAHKAAVLVVVDQAHGLHKGVHGGGANKLPTAFFQVF